MCRSVIGNRCGIVSTLFWEVSVMSLAFLFIETFGSANKRNDVAVGLAVGLGVILAPLSGWLGDCYIGRYRAVKCSLIVLWTLAVAYGAIEVISRFYGANIDIEWPKVSGIFIFFVTIFTGFFLVNNFFLGIDQIADAPSWQVSSYISWYACCYFVTFAVKSLAFQCTDKSIAIGLAVALLTAALCLDALCHDKIVKVPLSSDCLRLVFGVLQYSKNNKYPRLRYADSLWRKNVSRINLAKSIYGGPHTSEEVENVKTFLKIMVIAPVCAFLPGCFILFQTFSNNELLFHFSDGGFKTLGGSWDQHCFVRAMVYSLPGYIILVGVILYESIVYPLFRKYIASVSISKKLFAGMVFLLVTWVCYLTIEVAGHMLASQRNDTVVCLFNSSAATLSNGKELSLSFYWLCIPKSMHAIALYLLLASGLELLCAQCPGPMRGFLYGWMISMLAASSFVNVGIKHTFNSFSKVMEKYLMSCGVAYFTFSSIVIAVIVILTFVVLVWYSKRRRGDHIAEEYMEVGSAAQYQT